MTNPNRTTEYEHLGDPEPGSFQAGSKVSTRSSGTDLEGTIEPIVLDSNIVSYVFNRDSRALYYEERISGHHPVISFQTLQEAWYGAYSRRWGARRMGKLEAHLERYSVVWPNGDLVGVCARLRAERKTAGRELEMADPRTAATAMLASCPLAAHDRDYSGIPDLQLIQL